MRECYQGARELRKLAPAKMRNESHEPGWGTIARHSPVIIFCESFLGNVPGGGCWYESGGVAVLLVEGGGSDCRGFSSFGVLCSESSSAIPLFRGWWDRRAGRGDAGASFQPARAYGFALIGEKA
jgi:hypothetical protein